MTSIVMLCFLLSCLSILLVKAFMTGKYICALGDSVFSETEDMHMLLHALLQLEMDIVMCCGLSLQ